MPKALTPAQIAAYRENGILFPIGALFVSWHQDATAGGEAGIHA